jgi:hypothetical protein
MQSVQEAKRLLSLRVAAHLGLVVCYDMGWLLPPVITAQERRSTPSDWRESKAERVQTSQEPAVVQKNEL